jgi:hypothetical protein
MFGSYADAVLPGAHVVEGGQTSTGSGERGVRAGCARARCAHSSLRAALSGCWLGV